MKIKKIKKLKVNCYDFDVFWNNSENGGMFSYGERKIEIGIKSKRNNEIFMVICHELMEIVAIEHHVRLCRPDVSTDFIFVYDHRQHDSMMCMFSGLLSNFLDFK